MCGLSCTRQGIARPSLPTDAFLDLHHARLAVSHAVCWPAAASLGKCGKISTGTDWRIHGRQVLRLYRVQGHMVWHSHICHAVRLNCASLSVLTWTLTLQGDIGDDRFGRSSNL